MEYKNYNDYELIYMVRENDETSYGTLLEKYLPIIRRIAMDCYKGFSSYGYDFDDFVQEGYLAFQKALSSFDEDKDVLFYTYVSICVRRKIYSFCKKISSSKKNISYDSCVACEDSPLVDPESDISQYFSYQEFWKNIWDIIYLFPYEYAWIFELRMNHFQYFEIEELLGISIRRAQFIMRRIQKKIRKEMEFSF